MKRILPLLLLVALLYACNKKGVERPNIIFIMSDDHAAKAISAYDSNLIHTPNIDRLAENGIRFDRCFCTNAICAPSRAVILTGKYSHMNGVLDNSRPFDGEQQTLPKLLQQAGYQTAIVGKWHLKSDPTGFDHWYVLPGQGQYYRPDFISPSGSESREGYVTDIITDDGIAFIEKCDPEKPFFLMLHHKAPHRNWQPDVQHLGIFDDHIFPEPENLEDHYAGRSPAASEQQMSIARHMSLDYDLKMPEELIARKGTDRELFFNTGWSNPETRMTAEDFEKWKAYYTLRAQEYNGLSNDSLLLDAWKYQQYMKDYLACIYSVDNNIGRLLDYLEGNGLQENTIVIYTSDQGFFLGEHGWYDKRFMYEEAHRMPLLISIPGGDASTDKHMITNADFAPTILSLAGVDVPEDMQGQSFTDVIEGRYPGAWRDAVYYHYFEYPAVHQVKRHYGIRTEQYALIHFYYDIDAWEFYDLANDPQEMHNVSEDPAYTNILDSLKLKLFELQEQYGDTLYESYLPAIPEPVSHLAKGLTYQLQHEPSEHYPGNHGCLTDGMAYPEGEAYQVNRKHWCGFSGDDFVIDLDLQEEMTIKEIRAGFLQDQQAWIFAPLNVEFLTSTNGLEYMNITNSLCQDLEKDDRVMKMYARAEYPNLKARYIKVKAKNTVLPEWHPGAGKPAWLFVDEIEVLH
jgi:arylsulfatase A-like enzyme